MKIVQIYTIEDNRQELAAPYMRANGLLTLYTQNKHVAEDLLISINIPQWDASYTIQEE